MTESDLAYIAGLFDGEGSIRINYKGAYRSLPSSIDVRIGQNIGFGILEWIASYFGGTVFEYDNGYSQWIVTTTKAKLFLQEVMTYLRIKLPDAKIALEYQTYLDSEHQIRGVKLTDWQLAERMSFYEALMSERYGSESGWVS